MEDTVFPPSPSWYLPHIITTREDGSVSYGSKNNIIILKSIENKKSQLLIIRDAHNLKITAVAFSPSNCNKVVQNSVASCAEDGFVKLWDISTLGATIGHKCHWEQKENIGKIVSLDWSIANPCYIVSAADNNSIVLWDVLSNSTIKFSFQKLGATVISCCPHSEKVVAVGGKTGQVYIIRLEGNGDILYRLRGHDNIINSLSWCPVPYNIFKTNEIFEEFLLASACQNKEVYIWRIGSDGKCETKFQIPTNPLFKNNPHYYGKLGNSSSFTALSWLEPHKIYLASNFGELIYFDIHSYIFRAGNNESKAEPKKKNFAGNFFKLAHYFHTKGLYAITGPQIKVEVVLHKKMNIESELQIPIQTSNSMIIKEEDKQNDENWTWNIVKPDSFLLWTAGQDRKLIACDFNSLEIVFNYHTMNGVVYCAVVSPYDSNKIAIGVGDGMVRLWNMTQETGDIQVFWQKIKDRVLCLNWHPVKDGLLAYGTSEGRVGLIDTKSNKLPKVFKPSHSQPIYSLSWGPQYNCEECGTSAFRKFEFELYVIGDNTLFLYNASKPNDSPLNLSKMIPFPCNKQTDVCWKPDFTLMAVGNDDGSISLVEPGLNIACTLFAYKKLIQSLAWHPPSTSTDSGMSSLHGYFTSGSTDSDCEIRVFDCKKERSAVKVEVVAVLKGHHGYVQSVSWCPHLSGRLVSTSADGSVQIWDVISQTPLVNFIPCAAPLFSIWSPIDPDLILTGCRSDVLCIWKISTQTKVSPAVNFKSKKQKKGKNIQMSLSKEIMVGEGESETIKSDQIEVGVLAEPKSIYKGLKESKMFSKLWKEDADEELKTCFSLLKENDQRHYSLPFLCDDDYFHKAVDEEEVLCKKANNLTDFYELALWRGSIKDVLEEKITSGELNDFLVALAPSISPRLWHEACVSYAKSLADKKFYRKAASYLMVCHKIYDAIKLLTNVNLYLEAFCIGRCRLPKTDPILRETVKKYADWLFKNGSILKACECYIYLQDYLEVAKICGRKNQIEYLRLAALAAKKCNCLELESSEATNAVFKCFETNNIELARQVCEDHCDLEHLNLIYFVYNTLIQLDAEKLVINVDILSYIKGSFKTENIVFPSSLRKLFHKYSFYKKKEEALSAVTQELSFAACSKDPEDVLTHLIRALSICYRFIQTSDNVQLLYKLCNWLTPEGFLSSNSFFTLENNSRVKSLRAFLCASIVRHLNDNQNNEDILKFFELLSELKEDLLDPESYKYFQNLMEVEICEKRLLKNRKKLCKHRSESGKITQAHSKNNISSKGEPNLVDYKNVNEDKPFNNEAVTGEVNTERSEEENDSTTCNENDLKVELLESEKDRILETVRIDGELEIESDLEDKVAKDLDLLKSLKTEIENFESVRISTPNPVPVYFMLKKLCEGASENETARFLLKDMNEKWEKLN